jgi:hypothetical protein
MDGTTGLGKPPASSTTRCPCSGTRAANGSTNPSPAGAGSRPTSCPVNRSKATTARASGWVTKTSEPSPAMPWMMSLLRANTDAPALPGDDFPSAAASSPLPCAPGGGADPHADSMTSATGSHHRLEPILVIFFWTPRRGAHWTPRPGMANQFSCGALSSFCSKKSAMAEVA